jgi:hypothetical protein
MIKFDKLRCFVSWIETGTLLIILFAAIWFGYMLFNALDAAYDFIANIVNKL